MNKKILIFIVIVGLLIGGRMFINTQFANMAKKGNRTPVVEVQKPGFTNIIEKKEIVGRTEAKYKVNIVARVSGYLNKRFFNEGDYVKKGQKLFQIEPSDFVAVANQAKANIEQTQASLAAAEKNMTRVAELVDKDYVSKSEYDNALADRDSLKAGLKSLKAVYQQARLNLGYTNITAPVSGKIGIIDITEGNYVDTNAGTLATLVSVDPIYVSFNVNSIDYIRAKKENKLAGKKNVEVILPDDSIYYKKGVIDFCNNVVDETTGTIKLRATFENPDSLLLPGQFVNVKIFSDTPTKKMTVPQEAIFENPGGKFIYTVDKENTVKLTAVEVEGQKDGNAILAENIPADTLIVVKGLQKIRPNAKVKIINEIKNDNIEDVKNIHNKDEVKEELKEEKANVQ